MMHQQWVVFSGLNHEPSDAANLNLSPVSVFGPFGSKGECESWISERKSDFRFSLYTHLPKLLLSPAGSA